MPPPLETPRWSRFRRLLDYYLECVEEDGRQEFIFDAAAGQGSFVTIDLPREWNLLEAPEGELVASPALVTLSLGIPPPGSNSQLFYGYPVLASREAPQGGGASVCCYAPLFFQPVERVTGPQAAGGPTRFRLTADSPRPNRAAFQRLFGSSEELDVVLDQLGFLDQSSELQEVRIPEAVQRLAGLGLDLPLGEPLDPARLSPWPFSWQGRTVLLNRAIIFKATASRYTAGLERELRVLRDVPDSQLDGTALAPLFAADGQAPPALAPAKVVEVQPLNLEQRRAVAAASCAPLTVVTGPPGTGKSQVVLSTLAGAFVVGRPALFSSRNHKAVSVVEERAARLGNPPFLFRLGSHAGMGENLVRLLSPLLGQGMVAGVAEEGARVAALQQEQVAARDDLERRLEEVRVLRNELDTLDRRMEAALGRLSKADAAAVTGAGKDGDATELQALAQRLGRYAEGRRGGVASRLWWWLRSLFGVIASRGVLAKHAAAYTPLGAPGADGAADLDGLERYAARAAAYAEANEVRRAMDVRLARLEAAGSVDELALAWGERCQAVWQAGRAVLDHHRATLGGALTGSQRQALGQVAAMARSLAELDPKDRAAGPLRRRLGQSIWSVSQFLPTWAVTNLSAPGALPATPGMFDLAIIDEASQCDIPSAIPLLFRAKRALVIGDPNQLRHITTIPPARERQLAAKHQLEEAADQPFTFVANSLFDLAVASPGPVVIPLQDHFRSHEDIVGFSNERWYGSQLRMLTDYGSLVLPARAEPGLSWIQVAGPVTRPRDGGAVAEHEAAQVVKEVRGLVQDRTFRGSVGVVTPFRAQANLLRRLLAKALAAEDLERVAFIADTAHGFQGDERDVIVLSPCVGAPMPQGALRFLDKTGNLFNVAVTRARGQLRVVGDVNACLGCGVSHIEAFALYCKRLEARASAPLDPSIGVHERPLAVALREAGLPVLEQYVLGRHRVDLAIEDGPCRIAIEVDGEHYHTDLDGNRFKEDLARDGYLRRHGWTVLRFWAVEVRDRLPQCVARVLQAREHHT